MDRSGFTRQGPIGLEGGLLLVVDRHCLWARSGVIGLLGVCTKLVSELMAGEMVGYL